VEFWSICTQPSISFDAAGATDTVAARPKQIQPVVQRHIEHMLVFVHAQVVRFTAEHHGERPLAMGVDHRVEMGLTGHGRRANGRCRRGLAGLAFASDVLNDGMCIDGLLRLG
jgi:hypothetical protein